LNEVVVGIHTRPGNTQTVDKPQQRISRYNGACTTTAFVICQNYSAGGNGAVRTPGDFIFLHCIWRHFMSACSTKWVYRFVVYSCKCISLAKNQIVKRGLKPCYTTRQAALYGGISPHTGVINTACRKQSGEEQGRVKFERKWIDGFAVYVSRIKSFCKVFIWLHSFYHKNSAVNSYVSSFAAVFVTYQQSRKIYIYSFHIFLSAHCK